MVLRVWRTKRTNQSGMREVDGGVRVVTRKE